ncbi:MAG TPA: hypothetical protein VGR02_03675 [Thermoanaerobaculia bacterium]|jgi:hypothetical protein|nr:hypothetical protein [Thermoanaerobaculia bacterium]
MRMPDMTKEQERNSDNPRPTGTWARYGPAILSFAAVLILIAIGVGIMKMEMKADYRMPLVVVLAVLATFALLTFVASIYKAAWLHEWRMPLGLPEGSVRALIALGVIIIFAVITLFMLERLSAPFTADSALGKLVTAANSTNADAAKTAQAAIETIKVRQAAGQDLAKQLLTMLGTLLAAISSFYFGASTTASGANAATRLPVKPTGDGQDNPPAPGKGGQGGGKQAGGPPETPPPSGAFNA